MSEFIAIVSNVKIIRCVGGGVPAFADRDICDRFEDVFPQADVFVRNGAAHIFADLPGVPPKDISVYVCEDLVALEGVKSSEKIQSGHKFIRLERRFPPFRRIFKLPFAVKRYEAAIKDGVLHIALLGD